MFFVRRLLLLVIKFNIDLRAFHVPGVQNTLCDSISRFQASPELLQEHGMLPVPEVIPPDISPTPSLLKLALTSD